MKLEIGKSFNPYGIFWDMDGKFRKNIKAGLPVMIVEKHNQRSGKLTEGIVKDILTNSSQHPHGIKVRLTSGKIGRVAKILLQDK